MVGGNMTAAAVGCNLLSVEHLDGEPRIRDTDLAERLGYAEPRQIRELIKRNLEELQRYGLASYRTTPITSGKGRVTEVLEYWLNEGQALLICVKSGTEKAADVREVVIKTFLAIRAGTPLPVQALTLAIERIGTSLDRTNDTLDRLNGTVDRLAIGQDRIGGDVVSIKGDIVDLGERVAALETKGRRNFKADELRLLFEANLKTNGGICVGCQDVRIVTEDGRPVMDVCQVDHRNGNRNDHRIENAVPLCPTCHERKGRDHAFNTHIVQPRADMLHEKRSRLLHPLFPDLPVVRRSPRTARGKP